MTIIWVIWGVVAKAWSLPEIASQFFTMGLVIGCIGIIFKLNNLSVNGVAEGFKEGASSLLPAALVVGMAQGIVLLLGGTSPDTPSAINTTLNSASNMIGDLPSVLSAWLMLVLQSIFNIFVTSGSGQAAMTMPFMAPLSDLVGVTRQVSVLAFQLGDGLTNLIVPTSPVLMGVLTICRVDWLTWVRFIWRFMMLLFVIASIIVVGAQLAGFS